MGYKRRLEKTNRPWTEGEVGGCGDGINDGDGCNNEGGLDNGGGGFNNGDGIKPVRRRWKYLWVLVLGILLHMLGGVGNIFSGSGDDGSVNNGGGGLATTSR